MAAQKEDKSVKLWMRRISAAKKAQEEWEARYEVSRCREYWCGIQRDDPTDSSGERRSQINKILPTVKARIPSLFFYYPYARVVASPAKNDTPGETVDDLAQLLQDTSNALVRDPRCDLKDQVAIALKEAHWAFGCIEVGYSADFGENPMLKEASPPLKEDEHTEGVEAKPKDDEYEQPESIITDEWFWTRRIPPRQILVSAPESTIVSENDWIGYWEYQHVEDVKKAPAYKNTSDLKGGGDSEKPDDVDTSANDVKIYKIWDQRAKCRYVFAEGHKQTLLKQKYERLPLFFLRFEVEPDKFRPIPPIHNLLTIQDEYNDSREFLRMQRKTRVPRYTVAQDSLLPDELEKFEDNRPNVWIKRRQNTSGDVISPVMQPNMSDSALNSLTLSRQEFDELSGVGAESRQQASSDTATQAAIMNQRQTIQESFDRHTVAMWLGKIIRELMLLAIDKMTLPRWISLNTDSNSQFFPQDAMQIAMMHRQITMQNLSEASEELRWDVSVDVESLSPVSEQEKQGQWMQTLQLISNPMVAPLLAMSQPLLKRTLDLSGIKNGKDQAAVMEALQKKAQLEMQMAQQQAEMKGMAPMAGQPPPGGPPGPGGAVPQPPQLIPGPPEGMVQ